MLTKTLCASAIVIGGSLATAGIASAHETPSQIATKLTAGFNKRLAFSGSPYRVSRFHCYAEDRDDYYCSFRVAGLAQTGTVVFTDSGWKWELNS